MLVKQGNIYHAVIHLGNRKYKWTTTRTSDKRKAKRIHDHLQGEINSMKEKARFSSLLAEVATDFSNAIIETPGYPLDEVWTKYCSLQERPPSTQKTFAWQRFLDFINNEYPKCTTINDVTRKIALSYMDKYRTKTPKTFNNNKGYLSTVFRELMIYANIAENPFDLIIARSADSTPFRNYSDDEIKQLLNATKGTYWNDLIIVAYYTGLRKKDVSLLKWEQITDDIIELIPAKTKRNKKAVVIPIHPLVSEVLKKQKKNRIHVFAEAAKDYNKNSGYHQSYFSNILTKLNIKDNSEGQVGFHSLRSTFITNCEEAGIPRHVIMGIVGHGSSAMTKRYSHDIKSAKIIQKLQSI